MRLQNDCGEPEDQDTSGGGAGIGSVIGPIESILEKVAYCEG